MITLLLTMLAAASPIYFILGITAIGLLALRLAMRAIRLSGERKDLQLDSYRKGKSNGL